MKFIKPFNESIKPYSYLSGGYLFKYINKMIDDFDTGREKFGQSEIEECVNLIQDWVYNFTSNTIIGSYKSKSSIEFQFNGKYVLYLNKYLDEYYLIKAIIEIRGNRVPICVVIDSIDGLRMWSKTNPLEFIEEWGSLKESIKYDWVKNITQREWLIGWRKKEIFDPIERLQIIKSTRGKKSFIEFSREYNSDEGYLITYRKWGNKNKFQKLKLARFIKSDDEWFYVDLAGQNWSNFKCDGIWALQEFLKKISDLYANHESLHGVVNELDKSTIVSESFSDLDNQFFKKINNTEDFNYRKKEEEEEFNEYELSKVLNTLKNWNYHNLETYCISFSKKSGPKTFDIIITKFEDEWFLVHHLSSEPQKWKNRTTGQYTLVETGVDDDYYLCDQIDGLIYLLEKIK
jgi:hypothetical protein